jgi:hypothetical protein|tara:strand:- start:55925 stop:56101 length:177 start_codon:yes stop_codon:yes gene_type:complete
MLIIFFITISLNEYGDDAVYMGLFVLTPIFLWLSLSFIKLIYNWINGKSYTEEQSIQR